MSLNLVQIIGTLGRDPETRTFPNGGKVVNLRIATSEKWTDKATGEKKERTEWHSIAIFNEAIGRIAEQYLTKGSEVYLSGKLETRKWQDQAGNDRYTTEIVIRPFGGEIKLLRGNKRAGGDDGESRRSRDDGPKGGEDEPKRQRYSDLDDEIPF